MRKTLLKQMTWKDIKEISDIVDSLIVPFDDETRGEEEVFFAECLRRLRDENGVPPPIEESYPHILSCAEAACGRKLEESREKENTLIRCFVAYKLHNSGYSYSEIGKVMKRDHSTITHLAHRMRDMLSLPGAYKWEVQQFRRFEEMLNESS